MRRVIEPGTVELEFRGGVHDPYFEAARLDIFDRRNRAHAARVESLDSAAKPFKRVVARLEGRGASLRTGDVGRWALSGGGKPAIAQGHLHAPACDDLAAVAAALSCLDLLCRRGAGAAAGLLLTVAEEVGFIGAIAACKHKTIPRRARLVCLENSRSFAESPVGAGPIVRVGDRMSVFTPDLTNAVALLATEHQKANPGFRFQRRLMPGGTCEATAFASYGYASTCLCLPLGNYHNMADIDGVQAGARPALVAPEFISIDDYHGLIELLMAVVTGLDAAPGSPLRRRMEDLYRDVGPAVLVTSTTRRR
jgi:endoglucanase